MNKMVVIGKFEMTDGKLAEKLDPSLVGR